MSRIVPRLNESIAIIGISCRFPGANDASAFWQNLHDGVESISFFSPEELIDSGVVPSTLINPNFVGAGSILTDIDKFDASFFGLNAREAQSMDPQERFFLECAWHALEDAGYDPEQFKAPIGVYAGCSMSTYLHEIYRNPEFVNLVGHLQILIGNDKDYLTTHASYKLNLTGPSFSVQTTCSTSLVSVCLACDGLRNHNCDMALAGGVCIRVPQVTGYFHEPGGIYSPDGHCRVFDARAQGVIFGNGVGVVVLKRLEDAIADGDAIYALIKGYAINNDGSAKASYAAPGLNGQEEVIVRAQASAGIQPQDITYVETHGTGTTIGDPIEIAALTKAFRRGTDEKGFCAVGSVKTNFGHLDYAAGVAGLIKAVLALKHKLIPPSLHFEEANPEIDFDSGPFYVNSKLAKWDTERLPRRAAVSAFGIGGTNAHVVLEEAPAIDVRSTLRPYHLLTLSARTSSALETSAANLAKYLRANSDLDAADVAYTYQTGRRAFNHRRAVVYEKTDDLANSLEQLESKRGFTATAATKERPVAFMFSGQGSQYVNMGRGLYRCEAAFREQIDHCCDLLRPYLKRNLLEILYPDTLDTHENEAQLRQTAITQPALFVFEYSLAKLWMLWGIHPSAMIGHSIGEYVAACLAGVFSLEDALPLLVERGRLMQELPEGSMLAVLLPENDARAFLDDDLSLAALNERSQCVVSGTSAAIDRLEARLSQQGVSYQRLRTSHAFHSQMMDPVLAPFTEKVRQVTLKEPEIPYVSNVTGSWIDPTAAQDPTYWAQHLRLPVRFALGLHEILQNPDQVLLEIGPGETLSALARRHSCKTPGHIVLPSVRHQQEPCSDSEFLLRTVGRLWSMGVPLDWSSLHRGESRRRVHLPTYPFERRRFWVDPPSNAEPAGPITKKPEISDWFYEPSWSFSIAPEYPNVESVVKQHRWLIFKSELNAINEVEVLLNKLGARVTMVREGPRFANIAPNEYEINPKLAADYQSLFRELRATGSIPTQIMHFWSVTPEDRELGTPDFDRAQEMGLYSLISIAQALIQEGIQDPLQLVIVSNYVHNVSGEEEICPAKSTVLGACKAIPQEYPNLSCRNIDLSALKTSGAGLEIAKQLIAEVASDFAEPVVAYRGGQRWVQAFEPVTLYEAPEICPMLREGGVYMITGGLGKIGLELARHLAVEVRAKLVLVGRSQFPPSEQWGELLSQGENNLVVQKIRAVQELERLGSEVMLFSGDVADERSMQCAAEDISKRFGGLHGLIHGAGDLRPDSFCAIDQATRDLCERQFHSKIRGLLVLHKVFKDSPLDFWILMSSISSVLAGLGYVGYSAANIFMDSFATEHNRRQKTPWISINWDTWNFDYNTGADGNTNPLLLSMNPEEGLDALERILSWTDLPQVVVSTGDLAARIDQWIDLKSLRDRVSEDGRQVHVDDRTELSTAYVPPRNQMEQTISEVWQETLGVSRVGALDNFFTDLSGSSLLAAQLVAQLRNKFQVNFSLRRFLEAPTVEGLAITIQGVAYAAGETAKSANTS
jgi:acyl transferase domain-containing protein/acyl carrier protein